MGDFINIFTSGGESYRFDEELEWRIWWLESLDPL
jgi:hypothetical protein